MRLLLLESPAGTGEDIARTADDLGAARTARLHVAEGDAVLVRASNRVTEAVLDAVRDVPETTVTLAPSEAVVLMPDDPGGRRQLEDPDPRRGLDVYVQGLQSVGSWSSFLTYAVVAGALAWVALWRSSVFYMVGAVLVAPYPGAAVSAALATACGDGRLLTRSVVRYVVSLAAGAAVAFVLSLVAGMEIPTDLMRDTSTLSRTAALLPLGGGIAAALYVSHADRSSVLAAPAAGALVTVALVPPLGVIGMAAAIGEWEMARRALFLVILQLVGINLAGSIVLWAYRVRPSFAWIERGSRRVAAASFGVTLALVGVLLAWQLPGAPGMERQSVARQAEELVAETLEADSRLRYVDADLRFAEARPERPDVLIGTVWVQAVDGSGATTSQTEVRRRLQQQVADADGGATPLFTVTLLPPSPTG